MSPFARIGSSFRHRAAGRCGYVLFILFFEKFEEVGDERFFEEVALEPAVDEEIDEPVRPQQTQVLGYVRLANVERVFKITHAFHTLSEFFEYLDPHRMCNDFEEFDSFFYGNHFVKFSFRTGRGHNLQARCINVCEYYYAFILLSRTI